VTDIQGDETILHGDCLAVLPTLPGKSVDLVFGSPPYEDCRTYGIAFDLKGQAWVDWMVQVVKASLRVSKGLVAFVVEGKTRQYAWSATPVLLMADLHRAGITLRKPPAFQRVGIPGSGGPDWLRNDYEFIVCATNGGKLPWSDNTAMGHPPKWGPGGEMSHRISDGSRVNQWGHPSRSGATTVRGDGTVRSHGRRPSHLEISGAEMRATNGHAADGSPLPNRTTPFPAKANPGNVIQCIVGGGVMGSKLAHENEAPFPESLAEFFVRSFCPPGGTVLDPFSGSGTTGAVAVKHGRKYIGIDVRESQVELTGRRMIEAHNGRSMFAEATP
jgi:hypothetical protein